MWPSENNITIFIFRNTIPLKPEHPKPRTLSEELLKGAREFHGHRGPFLTLGLRIGLLALRLLNAEGWFDLKCRVGLPLRVPETCLLDGIQFSTGCTLGKRNIEIEEGEEIEVFFEKSDGSQLHIKVRPRTVRHIKEAISRGMKGMMEEAEHLLKASDEELFIVEKIHPPSSTL